MSEDAPIRAVVADDEPPARAKLERWLAAAPGFEVVATASDGPEAVAAIAEHRPDVVFLDVQMPGLDGFGVVEAVGVEAMPLTVFVTAYDEHAVRAFEVEALDYLLKPFSPSRFQRVLERIRQRLEHPPGGLVERLEGLLATLARQGRPAPRIARLLASKDDEREVILSADEVDLFRAQGNYVDLHCRRGVFRRRDTLSRLEEGLDPDRFLRINRSEIVRLDAVAEIQEWFHGDKRVALADGTTLSWSRRYRKLRGGDL